jgi:hypothetical protein
MRQETKLEFDTSQRGSGKLLIEDIEVWPPQ